MQAHGETMHDAPYVEYIWHKLLTDPGASFQDSQQHRSWTFPDCWKLRHYLYFFLHGHLLRGKNILDIGSGLNFYSGWALLNGANSCTCVEPDKIRFELGKEYLKIRKLDHNTKLFNLTADQYMVLRNTEKFDVVLLLEVFYYLTNGAELLTQIKQKIKPRYLFLESTVVDDTGPQGHNQVHLASTDSRLEESYSRPDNVAHVEALMPSRNMIRSLINEIGYEIVFYYDYHDFIGMGEDPPRREGKKVFYVLRDPTRDQPLKY